MPAFLTPLGGWWSLRRSCWALLLSSNLYLSLPLAAQPSPKPGALSSALGSEEHTVALADFNGDGHLDLALVNDDPTISRYADPQGAVTLWLGDGHGGLRHGPVLTGPEANVLASLDVDHDGDTDLLTGSRNHENLTLWRNDGHGLLTSSTLKTDWEASDLVAGDVDGDGDIDAVVPYGLGYQVGLNDGQGHFGWQFQSFRTTPFNSFEEAALADVDGDHDLDLLSCTTMPSSSLQVSVLLNDGQGHFGHEQLIPVGDYSGSLALGDLTGDARPDFVLVSGSSESFLTLGLNTGTGQFRTSRLATGLPKTASTVLHAVGLGDVDQDGDLDLVLNTAAADDVWVRLNAGQGQFGPAHHVPTDNPGVAEVTLADIDRDGLLELLTPIPTKRQPRTKLLPYSLFKLRLGRSTGPHPNDTYFQPVVLAPTKQAVSGPPRVVAATPAVVTPALPPAKAAAPLLAVPSKQLGVVQRQPGEADTTFLRRVVPTFFPLTSDFLAYAWRPSAFGKQLFFSVPGNEETTAYGRDLFVLDPFAPNTYAVHVLPLESLGDETALAALFFADVDHDGQKELLTLLSCELREPTFKDKHGQQSYGRFTHYQTLIFKTVGADPAGRPKYQRDPTERPYLDELSSAAAVRQALVRHDQSTRPHQPRLPPKSSR
jgi:hypothetical protein